MTLPDWDALPVRTKRSRKRLYAVLKGEYASLTAWKSLNINVKRSKIHLHNYIAGVLNLDSYDELDKQVMRSTRLWYGYVKTNASGSSPTLTITVTDGTDPISSASVKIGSTTQTTNGEGKTTFSGLTYADYAVKVTKANYYDLDDTVRFRANHKNFTLPLTELPTLTVKVTDSATTPAAISGATVTIDDVDKTTNASGEATFKLDYGDYEASVSATGYNTKTADIEFTSSKTSASVKLEEASASTGTVTVTAYKGAVGEQLENGSILLTTSQLDWETISQDDSIIKALGFLDNSETGIAKLYLFDTETQSPTEVDDIPFGNYYLSARDDTNMYFLTNESLTVDGDEEVTITLTLVAGGK